MNTGIIYSITEGLHTGNYGFARNSMQKKEFEAVNRIHIQIFTDKICTKPIQDEDGGFITTLKKTEYLKQIGFID